MNQKKSPCQQIKNPRAVALNTRVTSGAQANGIAINTVTGILTDGQTYISNSPITFSISPASSAKFRDGTTSKTINTDTLGEATTDLVDTIAETVTVTLNASEYGASTRASTTFTADGGGNLYPPFIDQVLNQTVELELLTLPVTVSAEGNFLAGQELVLRLYGNDASGAAVPDTIYSHTFPAATNRVAFDVPFEVLKQYGGTDVYPHDSGRLGIIYTLDGQPSPATLYNVYGPGGINAHNYTLTAQVVESSAQADGKSACTIYWAAREDGTAVPGLKANLSVDGSAGFKVVSGGRAESGEATLPVLVNYTDNVVQTVEAKAVLVGYPMVSASAQLAFTAVNTYQVHSNILQNNAVADGSAVNRVEWTVTDQNNQPVSNVAATASVSGSALIVGGSAVTLPATVSYTDTVAQAVTAGMTLTESGASAAAPLTFKAKQTLTVHGDIKTNNVDADGSSKNVVHWRVTDENNNPVTGLHGNISVTGSARPSLQALTLPGDVSYTDHVAENISTTLTLDSGEKGTASLEFNPVLTKCYDSVVFQAHADPSTPDRYYWLGAEMFAYINDYPFKAGEYYLVDVQFTNIDPAALKTFICDSTGVASGGNCSNTSESIPRFIGGQTKNEFEFIPVVDGAQTLPSGEYYFSNLYWVSFFSKNDLIAKVCISRL